MLGPLEDVLAQRGRRPPEQLERTCSRSSTATACGCSSSSTRCSTSPASRRAACRPCTSRPTSPRSPPSWPASSDRPSRGRGCAARRLPAAAASPSTSTGTCGRRSSSTCSPTPSSSPSRARSRSRCGERDADVVLAVRDTGVGHPGGRAAARFERFHRVEGRAGRTHEGTGIGLALVQELVRLHGGDRDRSRAFSARAAPSRSRSPTGSTHLPADRVGATRRTPPRPWWPTTTSRRRCAGCRRSWRSPIRPRPSGSPEALPRLSRRASPESRILVADDNADMRDYVRRLLGARYEVEAVADGGGGARGRPRTPAGPGPGRRDDAAARRLRAAAGAARRPRPRDCR